MNQVKSRKHAKRLIAKHTVACIRAAGAGAMLKATALAEAAGGVPRDTRAVKQAIWGLTLINFAAYKEAEAAHRYGVA